MNKVAVGNLRITKNQFSMQPATHRGTHVSVHTKTQHILHTSTHESQRCNNCSCQ